MPTVITHGLVAAALGKIFTGAGMPARFWLLSAGCAILPDADVIGFSFGFRYGDPLGHRGFSHSLLFALLLACLVVFAAFRQAEFRQRRLALVAYFFVVTASHGALDALTDGGSGVAFFWPFDNTRYFFPWRPIEVSPISIRRFFSEWGLAVVTSELLWILLPAALAVAIATVARRLRARQRNEL